HTIQLLLKMFIDSHNKNKEVFIISKDGDSARKLTAKVANLFPSIAKEDAIAAVDGSLADIADLVK
ncbi:hypothetical protein, partial [Vibrio parahaemolyticus]